MGRKGKKAAAERARRAAAARAAGVPPLAPSRMREPSGRPSRAAEASILRTALVARARHAGWITGAENPDDRDDQKRVARALARARAQSLEGEAGLAITVGARDEEERERLWSTWVDFSSARLAWHRRILGALPFPAMPRPRAAEDISTGPEAPPDDRTPEERDEAAARRWAWWAARLRTIQPHMRDALRDAVAGGTPFLRGGKLTRAGAIFLAALRAVARAQDPFAGDPR